jgi:hypothetical protein
VTAPAPRPFCSEVARDAAEPLSATASRVEHWLLVEYSGHWPHEPLDAAVLAGPLREHLAAQLGGLPRSRLLLIKRPGRRTHTGVQVVYGTTTEAGGELRGLEVERHEDLLDLDLAGSPGRLLDHPLLLVCTHGIRDRCCARYGQSLLREVVHHAERHWVWQASHVGGDRFAGNLVVLPEGLYFGRVGEEDGDVVRILEAYRAGRIDLARYRGRSCHAFPVQAAEGHVRRATGLTAISDLRLHRARPDASDRFTIELLAAPTGVVHEVEVAVELGEPVLLTCKSRQPQRPRHHVVRAHRERRAV